MFEKLCCPECLETFKIPSADIGRVGNCKACGLRIRFASPIATRVGPASEVPSPDPTARNERPDAAAPSIDPEENWPDKPLLLDAGTPPVKKVGKSSPTPAEAMTPEPTVANRRQRSTLTIALLALVGLIGITTGGVILVRQLITPVEKKESAVAKNDPEVPPPAPPVQPPQQKLPTPQPQQSAPQPQPPPKATQTPAPPKTDPKSQMKVVKLPDSVFAAYPGGGGQLLVLQLTSGQFTLYDAIAGATTWTIPGYDASTIVAAGREKLFLCRPNDMRITRYDIRTGEAEKTASQVVTTQAMTIGSGSDGPLLFITRNQNGAFPFRIRLLNGETLTDVKLPLDNPELPKISTIPFTMSTRPARIAMSVDGRAFTLGNHYFVRRGDGCMGGKFADGAFLIPGPDGRSFIGSTLLVESGQPRAFAALPPGFERTFFPVGGAFVASIEFDGVKPKTVKLNLHTSDDHFLLGSLPASEEILAWAAADSNWLSILPQRLFFAPNSGCLLFIPPGSAAVHVFPVDLPAMLEKSERNVLFASVPPADVRTGKEYTYQATAVSSHGPTKYTLEKGPPGMTMTPNGLLTWPSTEKFKGTEAEVRISAKDARGRTANQTFQLLLPRANEP